MRFNKDLGDLNGMHQTLHKQGVLALLEGDYAQARRYYEQALAISQDLGDSNGVASALVNIADCAVGERNYREAGRYMRESLQITIQHKHVAHQTPYIFISIGELFLHTGRRARGIELLSLALRYPSLEHTYKERAQHLLTLYRASVDVIQQALTIEDFEAASIVLLDELQLPENTTLTRHTPYTDETLVEPLSERELEVLTLVVEEHSNREIADQLFLAVGTVKWYLTNIYSKLGVQNRTLAILRARQLNLLP